MKASLTVFFEDPFWVGVFERIEDGKLSACKVTFGAEPKDYEVWDYILHHYYELVFSPAVETEIRQGSRNARKHLENAGIGTKSQQALQRQREEMKKERRQISREEREAEAQRRFELKQAKKKEKKRGH